MKEVEKKIERLFQNDAPNLPDFERMWERINPTKKSSKRAIMLASFRFLFAVSIFLSIIVGWNTNPGMEIRQNIASIFYDDSGSARSNGDTQEVEDIDTEISEIKNKLTILKNNIQTINGRQLFHSTEGLPITRDYIQLLSAYLPEDAYIQKYVQIGKERFFPTGISLMGSLTVYAARYNGDSSEELMHNLAAADLQKFTVNQHDVYYFIADQFHYMIWNQMIKGQMTTLALGSTQDRMSQEEMLQEVEKYID